jgi:hypothetical protein
MKAISNNGRRGVMNYIMGSNVFINMSASKRWIPIRSMGYMHTHRGIPAIERWGSSSCVRNVMEKTKGNYRNVGKTNQVVSQMAALGLEHDKIRHDGP